MNPDVRKLPQDDFDAFMAQQSPEVQAAVERRFREMEAALASQDADAVDWEQALDRATDRIVAAKGGAVFDQVARDAMFGPHGMGVMRIDPSTLYAAPVAAPPEAACPECGAPCERKLSGIWPASRITAGVDVPVYSYRHVPAAPAATHTPDAVGEALTFTQRFSMRGIGGLVQPEITGEGAWILYADHARIVATLTAKLAAESARLDYLAQQLADVSIGSMDPTAHYFDANEMMDDGGWPAAWRLAVDAAMENAK